MKYEASCSCGEVKLSTDSEPKRVSICHCYACQKRTGSIFGVHARFNRDQVTTDGNTTQYVRTTDSKNEITFHFCPKCGDKVFWYLNIKPESIVTGVGSFNNPEFTRPTVAVFEHRKHYWLDFSDLDIEHYNEVVQ